MIALSSASLVELDGPILLFQIDMIPSTMLTFFFDIDIDIDRYCDVIELTGKSRDLVEQVLSAHTVNGGYCSVLSC